jgi:hypothetical protein
MPELPVRLDSLANLGCEGCDATPLGQFFLGYSEDMPSELLPFARHFFPIVRKSVKQKSA